MVEMKIGESPEIHWIFRMPIGHNEDKSHHRGTIRVPAVEGRCHYVAENRRGGDVQRHSSINRSLNPDT
uniref:Uncharacterized protein n=1 Tax=Rubinisphaera brasiliensis (strain ATCC 49424 / DSM 5305 / JCM 21570 / IAM 15109 / NBRC 103401 / IFAM 1448) TaxID=756272 RepID=F0SQ05_RUBBR|nr:hypothetical protein Plabr_2555 [Rubinisphaera brasiliensis DSM 5305]